MDGEDVGAYTGESCSWYDMPCHASSFAEWLVGIIAVVPRFLFWKFTEIVGDLLLLFDIAVLCASCYQALPDALNVLGQGASAVSGAAFYGSAVYLVDVFALKEGLSCLMLVLAARFLLRAIPFSF